MAALAQSYRKELHNRIGKPLSGSAESQIQREIRNIQRELDQASREVSGVKRQADQLKRSMDQSNRTVGKQAAGALAAQQRKTDGLNKPLAQAAKRLRDIAPDLSKMADAIRTGPVRKASTAVAAKRQNLVEGRHQEALKQGKQASEQYDVTAREADATAKAIKKVKAKDVVRDRLRRLLAEMEKGELQQKFKEAFAKEFRKNGLPALVKKFNADYERQSQRVGVVPPESIEDEIVELLRDKLPEKVRAGSTSTHKMRDKQKLDAQAGKPDDGEMEKRVGDHMRKAADSLASRQMGHVVASGINRAVVSRDVQKLGTDERNRIALADRLGNLKSQLAAGRRGFLGTGNHPSLMRGHQRRQDRARLIRQRLSRHSYYSGFDRASFLAMIEKMKDRTDTKGETFALAGAQGEASTVTKAETLPAKFVLRRTNPVSAAPIRVEPDRARKVTPPKFKHNRFAGIPFLNKPIKIDGDLDDWKAQRVPRLDFSYHLEGKAEVQSDKKVHMWVAYNSRGLYLAVDAPDLTGKLEDSIRVQEFWLNDCVEIFIDSQNTKYSKRGEKHTHQFFVFPFGHRQEQQIGGYEARFHDPTIGGWTTPRYPIEQFPRAGKKTPRGWRVEFLIPKSLIRRGELKPGRIIGFTVNVCVGDRHKYFYWCFHPKLRPSENPHTWGDIQLLGSDAGLSVAGNEDKVGPVSLIPGEILKVRVNDGDMDLNDRAKDKLRVKVMAASGDYEELVLEETAVSSGVFEGSILTRLNIGSKQPNVLEVYEGESATITYIDQAQAFGERDVRIEEKFEISSSGASFVPR